MTTNLPKPNENVKHFRTIFHPLLLLVLFFGASLVMHRYALSQAPGATEATSVTNPEAATPATVVDAKVDSAPADVPPTTVSLSRSLLLVSIGVISVLVMMIFFKLHAFVALILSALVISMLIGGNGAEPIQRVVREFGASAGGIGIVIGMAAIIGKCMLDSGAADKIVQAAVSLLGQKRAPTALMGSAYLLAIPVFFDTVFYLLVPLARSLYRKTQSNYLQYLMAVAAGGAVTHTLVPPTPGPLFVAANLDINMGTMIIMGLIVALPCAIVGLFYGSWCDARNPIAMRPVGGAVRSEEEIPTKLPNLFLATLPVVLPVALISLATVFALLADDERTADFKPASIKNWDGWRTQLREELASTKPTMALRLQQSSKMDKSQFDLLVSSQTLDEQGQLAICKALNDALKDRKLYSADELTSFKLRKVEGTPLPALGLRTKTVELQRYNRVVLESAYPQFIEPHVWDTTLRIWCDRINLWGDPSMALILAAMAALIVLWRTQNKTLVQLGDAMEESLLSAGVIILITAAGGAFGKMLQETQIADALRDSLQGNSGESTALSGLSLLLLGYGISAFLKIAQGSSTVAMIVASSMIAAIVGGGDIASSGLVYHPVYLALAIGSGSLMGSWMNDSGFWVYAKMGGLTEAETLKSWTTLLAILSITGLAVTILLAYLMPLVESSGNSTGATTASAIFLGF